MNGFINIYLIHTIKEGLSVEIRVFCSCTSENVACGNRRMCIETLEYRKK